jgi:hypothetical protein
MLYERSFEREFKRITAISWNLEDISMGYIGKGNIQGIIPKPCPSFRKFFSTKPSKSTRLGPLRNIGDRLDKPDTTELNKVIYEKKRNKIKRRKRKWWRKNKEVKENEGSKNKQQKRERGRGKG